MSRPLVILAYPKVDHEKNYVYFWMPFSLLAIARHLVDREDVDVVLFDGNQSSEDDWRALLAAELPRTLFIGVSIMTGGGQIGHALQMVATAREYENCPMVVFGGPHVNVLPEQTVAHEQVDAVLVGPGQRSVPIFVDAVLGKVGFSDVPGLFLRTSGTNLIGPPNPPRAEQLGRYPWHLLDVERYVRNDPTIASRTLNYVSSQGCVYKCRFCYELTYQRKYSAIGGLDLAHDVATLQAQYSLSGVKFYDADWFVDLRRASCFCDAVLQQGLSLKWAASINPNDVLKARKRVPDLLNQAAQSGCSRLLMGVESGSDRVLREIVEKDVTVAQILDVASEIAANGIMGSYTFIVGFPGESSDEQEHTYELINELRKLKPQPETRVHLFAPYPGTPLYSKAIDSGFSPPSSLEGWSGYDYYSSQTPWTNDDMAKRARDHTFMTLAPVSLERPN